MEVLIVIVVIGVLAAMMILSGTESVTTAQAAKILANLQTLKRAAAQWYLDNSEKVQPNGTVMLNGQAKPVQEWGDQIQLSKYISSMNDSGIKFHTTESDTNSKNQNTNLAEGYYGLCNGSNAWYVGYCFKSGEKKVRDKIRNLQSSAGVFLGTADAREDNVNNTSAAVWMRVL